MVFITFLFQLEGQSEFTDATTISNLNPIAGAEGVAVGDYNNDGYDDFYVSFVEGKNQFYKNNGDGTFTEMGAALGIALEENTDTRTAVWGDINNDGWLDLYVGNKAEPDQLFLNFGNDTFENITLMAGVENEEHPKSVNFADLNNDGLLDIYVSNFGKENVLYLNNGDLTFQDYSLIGSALDRGRAMGTVIFDYDKDGDLDLYLVHDGMEPNFLYQNDGQGGFTEIGNSAGVDTKSFGMGVDIGDINNDGWMDIYITNFGPNFLLLNNADGTFSNIAKAAKVDHPGMGWGTNFIDFDKDGFLDIYIANDSDFSGAYHRNILFRNKGGLTFEYAEREGAVCNEMSSYGSAYLDYNLDGNQDMLVVNREEGEGVYLYKNPIRENNWVGLKLVGTTSNHNGIGAKIQLTDDLGNTYHKEVIAGHSWESQSTLLQNFGLGTATNIESLIILWPSRIEQHLSIDQLNQYYTITEGEGIENGVGLDKSTSTKNLENIVPNLTISPNPNDGYFLLEFNSPDNKPLMIQVLDIMGRPIFNQLVNTPTIGKNILEIQLANIDKNCLLIVQLVNENGFGQAEKVLIKH